MSQTVADANQNQSGVTENLTLAQIEARFPDAWVLIENPELDEDLEIVHGRVITHSPDRADIHRYDMQHRSKSAAYLYTGELPEVMAINL